MLRSPAAADSSCLYFYKWIEGLSCHQNQSVEQTLISKVLCRSGDATSSCKRYNIGVLSKVQWRRHNFGINNLATFLRIGGSLVSN